jgi:hypothetical protein
MMPSHRLLLDRQAGNGSPKRQFATAGAHPEDDGLDAGQKGEYATLICKEYTQVMGVRATPMLGGRMGGIDSYWIKPKR